MFLEILSRIANKVKSPKLDNFIENLEQKANEKAKNKRIARTLAQAQSIIVRIK